MKVDKKTGSFYILGHLLELIVKILVIWKLFFQTLANFGLFFHGKSFVYRLKLYFLGRILGPKINTLSTIEPDFDV